MAEVLFTGIYPRSSELVKATRDLDRKRITKEQSAQFFIKDVDRLVSLEQKYGFKFSFEGQLLFQDIFRPFAVNLEGLSVGALTRCFENNTFFKQPEVSEKIGLGKEFITDYYFTNLMPQRNRLAVLPGPFTFFTRQPGFARLPIS